MLFSIGENQKEFLEIPETLCQSAALPNFQILQSKNMFECGLPLSGKLRIASDTGNDLETAR